MVSFNMNKYRFLLLIGSILIITIFSVSIIADADSTSFHPAEGTSSTYKWDFNGFSLIYVLNTSHYDFNDPSSAEIVVQNPTSAEFNVTYKMVDDLLLEECIVGVISNGTHSFNFMPSYLVNITTREYVNDEGQGSSCFASGYIDPNNLSLGSKVNSGSYVLNITAKERITAAGESREAWKLEYISEYVNQTLYYDVQTGILIEIEMSTFSGSIGRDLTLLSSQDTQIQTERRVLIATNAWGNENTTDFSIMGVFFGLMMVSVVLRGIRKVR